MRDEDDALAGIDLTAWEPPAPPASLVDGVIARAKESAMPALVEPTPSRVANAAPRGAHKRWWIAGGVAASVAAVAAFGLWGLERAKPAPEVPAAAAIPTSGEVVATHAQALVLGASTARLEPGARIAWRREGARLVVAQRAGSAAWQVDRGDTLVIDAGAEVASVEASGASLRVEVTMLDRTDVRIATATTAIAATVALVTVLVYEGTAKVVHDGHTVNVVAGERYAVNPQVTLDDQATVGSKPVDVAAKKREIEEFEQRIRENNEKLKALENDAAEPPKPASTCDEVSCVLTDYEGACCAKFKQEPVELAPPAKQPVPASTCDEVSCVLHGGACCDKFKKKPADGKRPDPNLPLGLDRSMITSAMAAIEPQLEACGASFKGKIKLKVWVGPAGEVTRTTVIGPNGADDPPEVAACLHGAALNLVFPKTREGGAFGYPLVYDGTPTAAPAPMPSTPSACDVDALLETGNAFANAGSWDKELVKFDAAYRCKPSDATAKRAFAAACNAKDAAKAKSYYAKLPVDAQNQLLPFCKRNGIEPNVGACDADILKAKGEALLQVGKDVPALSMFEQSLACRQDSGVRRLAFMAACRAKDAAKATQLFSGMVNTPSSLSQICLRNGISLPATGSIVVTTTTGQSATIELDGVAVGTTPVTITFVAGQPRRLTVRTDSHEHTVPVTVRPNEKSTFAVEVQ